MKQTKEQKNEYNRRRREEKREEINENRRIAYKANPEKYREEKARSDRKPDVKERRIKRGRDRYANNSEEMKAAQRARRNDATREAGRNRWATDPQYRARCYEWRRKRYQTDPQFKIGQLLRSRLNAAIIKGSKTGSAVDDLGCTISELIHYLESLFLPDMTWDNWSRAGWHIDHIRPLSSFDLSDPTQLRSACHYTNLQPLWAIDNLRKGSHPNYWSLLELTIDIKKSRS